MKLLTYLKEKAKLLKKDISVLYYAYQNPETKILPKIIILFTLIYAASPIDLIPDFIPIIGYLDDIIIVPLLITLSIKLIPKKIIDDCRQKVEKEPVRLKKNWFFAIIFICIWILIIISIILSIIKLFSKR